MNSLLSVRALLHRGLAGLLLLALPLAAQTAPKPAPAPTPPPAANPADAADIAWHDVTSWGVEGRMWTDQARARWFDRLPAAAEQTVTKRVWDLSRDSTGMMVRFKTDANAIYVHYVLHKADLAMSNMPATGVSGIDLYARNASGQWRWVQVIKPETRDVRTEIIKELAPGPREFAAYLPLFNGVESLEIGVPAGASFEGLAPRPKPIVFFGTSITHGSAASRPGMPHPAILGRRLDRHVVNLGFSGNGRMDAAVGDLLAQVDAAAFVIDCLPNMNPQLVTERCAPLVKRLRAARPDTPIILVEDRRFTNEWIVPAKVRFHDANHAALHAAFTALQQEGVKHLYYIPGDHLYGDDAEGANDGSHASDLGFMRQADVMEPVLRAALGQ